MGFDAEVERNRIRLSCFDADIMFSHRDRFQIIHSLLHLSSMIVKEIFSKATKKHHLIPVYTQLCVKIHNDSAWKSKIRSGTADAQEEFRKILVNRCQANFEASFNAGGTREKEIKQTGTVKFIGHLINQHLFSTKVGKVLVEQLLERKTASDLMAVCGFLESIAPRFESSAILRPHLNRWFAMLKLLSEDSMEVPSRRVRKLMKDLLDLRGRGWVKNTNVTTTSTPSSTPSPGDALREVTNILVVDVPDDTKCPQTQRMLSRREILGQLSGLYSGIQHYIELDPARYDDPHEMLFMFIKGVRPLPKCIYDLGPCPLTGDPQFCPNLSTDHEIPLCNSHRCHLPIGGGGPTTTQQKVRCSNRIDGHAGQRYLCRNHACTSHWYGVCERPRSNIGPDGRTNEYFCDQHLCFKCVQLGICPAVEAWDEQPRNVCGNHPLCMVFECLELAKRNEDYCERHSVVWCEFVDYRGWRCHGMGMTRDFPFCEHHAPIVLDQREAAQRFSLDVMDVQSDGPPSDAEREDPDLAAAVSRNTNTTKCAGKNKKGKACGAFVMPGSKFCHAHAPPTTSFAQLKDETIKTTVMTGATTAASTKDTTEVSISPGIGRPPRNVEESGGFLTPRSDVALLERRNSPTLPPAPLGLENVHSTASRRLSERSDDSVYGAPPPGLMDALDGPGVDNPDEVEEADGMQHLREIFDVEEKDLDEELFDQNFLNSGAPPASTGAGGTNSNVGAGGVTAWSSSAGDQQMPFGVGSFQGGNRNFGNNSTGLPGGPSGHTTSVSKKPNEWTWNMPLQERWEACQDFMLKHKNQLECVMELIKEQMPVARKELQDADVRAKAKVYEDKTIIGGTIVGCIARLEAIRATKPFAILVEEASEVLEPLLFACLCPSTVKFQMIGDHLQLSPSIMQVGEVPH